MKAIVITQPGAPDVLQLQERPLPVIKHNEVLIKVKASGVNRPDVAQRKGNYPPPEGASPDIPGLEIAGEITQIGKEVTRFKIGDKVCALVSGGGYAEFCAAPEGQCLPIPGNLTFGEAASLPETFFTVWSNVFDRGKLQPGESLLVHGGSSGIGVTAIQMGVALGSTVYVTAGSEDKCRFCEELGALKAINYKKENFSEQIKELTNGKGVNVILDMVGGDYTQQNLQILAEDGRLVLINTMKGKDVAIDLSLIMRKRLTITGSTLRNRDVAFKAAIAANLEKYAWPLIASGKIKPVIYKIFQAAEASAAHQLMEDSTHMGKIVLSW
ncbi:NAD(P)H-quinone oxidoreductase [Mucilaginibacter achroorhodeus]|uniref:NAD(P)H-quinone oxidoreductase n=1 Tax=Mucilaginibacter achroorhodeus TaxID=2599294 RepID=A0A563U9C9_9SPHI|nr:NAD(P)H-quinone oxidoreductase [Mucilaginibacter achroorhodeus]TWR27955.1 NAD(P)H-quinone oxidoreductase [Mucilaginibacter achroorhodeus]